MAREPLRLRVMKAMQAVIEAQGITVYGTEESTEDSNSGHGGTLADKVFRGRNWFGEDDPIPMIAILEKPIAPDQLVSPEEAAKSTGNWDLLIQGFCDDDSKNPSDPAYFLAADVITALAGEKSRVAAARRSTGKAPAIFNVYANGKPAVTDFQIGAPVCRPPDEISEKAYFWLQVSIRLVENLEDPFG